LVRKLPATCKRGCQIPMQFYTECIVVGSRSEIKVGIFDFVLDGSVGSGQICAAVGLPSDAV